jgi:hypothetical protein
VIRFSVDKFLKSVLNLFDPVVPVTGAFGETLSYGLLLRSPILYFNHFVIE